jgi:hypothetical protein
MDITTGEGRIEISTTYEHMARSIGEAIQNAYKGDLDISYLEAEKFVRIRWKRD